MKDPKYIHSEEVHNTSAAEIVVPLIMKTLHPVSVLDVGCGIGTWLSVFKKNNVRVIKGIDGDYIDKNLLAKYMDEQDFVPVDLSSSFNLNRKFDLVVSLEVAEHLPESSANVFVESLTRHGENILFSAAIPFQDGQNHLNEQWQSYWVEKFESRGYEVYDWLRPLIWQNEGIEMWYRQNVLFFSKNKWPLAQPMIQDLVLPHFWNHRNKRFLHFKNQTERIKDGKVGFFFYVKGLVKSMRFLGRKVK